MSLRPNRYDLPGESGPVSGGPDIEQERKAWAKERDRLLNMLAQQQRIAHTGLITSGLVHEISNFVMLMSGTSYMAARSNDPTRWRDTLNTIPAKCDEIVQTMESVLAFTGKRGDDELESFHAAQAIRQAVRLLAPLASADDVDLAPHIEDDTLVVGEQQLLVQAIVNLGSNAIRACEGGGRVRVHVSKPDASTCRIDVVDNGTGVPEHLRGRLFQPFTTGAANSGGHGLGMFIVRQVIRRMSGTIRVTTSPNGTTVRLEIPAAE